MTVWHGSADVLADPRLQARADTLLTETDRARRDRFRHEADRRMFVLGRTMARLLVARTVGCEPQSWTWREGPHGRPEIAAPSSSVHFNLAHSAGLVACAVAHGREVGVDVEHLGRRPLETAIVERYCAPSEAADIRTRGGDWHARFLVYWTLKEAYLKARGLGIAVPLAEIAFDVVDDTSARIGFLGSLAGTDDRWSFTLAYPTADHLMAVAVPTAGGAPLRVEIRAISAEELVA